jgi:hypothetical protein
MGFRQELEHIINKYSKENGSDTPDFILADFLVNVLADFDRAAKARDTWYGRHGLSTLLQRADIGENGS